MLLIVVAVGGALGAIARYVLGSWVQAWAGPGFPWGTLAVNLVGCLALGLAMRTLSGVAADAALRAFVTVGFLGAFTTFSTFSMEAVWLLQRGEWLRGAAYVGASVAFGLLGAWIGLGGAEPFARAG